MLRTCLAAGTALLLSLTPAYAKNPAGSSKDAAASPARETGNKALARQIIETMWNLKNPEAAAKLFAPDYIEHMANATRPGVEGFLASTKSMLQQFPEVSATIHQIIGEGDMVAAYVHWKPRPDEPGFATGDFFRFRDGKLVEHWSVAQPVPTEDVARNSNGVF